MYQYRQVAAQSFFFKYVAAESSISWVAGTSCPVQGQREEALTLDRAQIGGLESVPFRLLVSWVAGTSCPVQGQRQEALTLARALDSCSRPAVVLSKSRNSQFLFCFCPKLAQKLPSCTFWTAGTGESSSGGYCAGARVLFVSQGL